MSINQNSFFGEISLDRKIVSALTDMGFEEPSPIQTQTIPLVLSGIDVIGQAQTGTGKTAAVLANRSVAPTASNQRAKSRLAAVLELLGRLLKASLGLVE